jgi:hypothetical protein
VKTRIRAIWARYPKFSVALLGAVAISAFSVLGGACAVTPVSGPVSPVSDSGLVAQIVQTPVPVPASSAAPTSATPSPIAKAAGKAPTMKAPAHVVIVLEENESPQLLATKAPYIAALERHGANFTNAFAETHPSEPNYLALFSGSTHGVTTDACPVSYSTARSCAESRTRTACRVSGTRAAQRR